METADNIADANERVEPDTKRRKLRKGTTSCWDCKKRKVKCIFAETDTVCEACRRRNAPCIRQDEPEEVLHHRKSDLNGVGSLVHLSQEQLLERLQRAEDLLARSDGAAFNYAQLPTPSSVAPTPEHTLLAVEHENISSTLRQAYPPQRDIDILCKSDPIATFYCFQCLTGSTDRLEHEAPGIVDEMATIPDGFTTPPVLMAKRMLILALMLQYFRCGEADHLSEDPNTIATRMVDSVSRLVTNNDQLVGCIEGLECIVNEAVFQSNCGNLRRAWIGFRRAMVFAQLMKLDLPTPPPVKFLETRRRLDPKYLWFRIVHMDSYLSLMLGLPHGGQAATLQHSILGANPSRRIDQAHTLIACRIIDRNRLSPHDQDVETITRELDHSLLDVAKNLPDKYWLPPNFTKLEPNTKEAFQELMRLRDQLNHYNLLHLLHLPFLLRCGTSSGFNMHSKITCINASRDVLTRFIAFHNFRPMITQSCHTADFFALMAGMTILIAHIDSYRWKKDSFLMHQRLGDRAMVAQLVEGLELVAGMTNDSLTGKSAEQLRCLLEIEEDAAGGKRHTGEGTVSRLRERCGEQFLVSIPYFGVVTIGTDGVTRQTLEKDVANLPSAGSGDNDEATGIENAREGFAEGNASSDVSNMASPTIDLQQLQTSQIDLSVAGDSGDFGVQQPQYPGMVANVNDWAFQGVDAAFFDSLMSGTNWDQEMQSTLDLS